MRRPSSIAVLTAAICFAPLGDASSFGQPRVYDSWQRVTPDEHVPLEGVRSIHVNDRQVWVGTDHGLAALIDRQWHHWSATDGLVDYPIAAIAIDPRTQDVWLGTWGGGLVRFSAGRFDRFHQFNSGLAGDLVTSVVVSESRIWAATNGGISEFDPFGEEWKQHHGRHARRSDAACVGLVRRNGGLLAGLQGTGLARIEPKQSTWHAIWPPTGDVTTAERNDFLDFAIAGTETWLMTGSRIWHASGDARRITAAAWTSRRIRDWLPTTDSVTCMAASPFGKLWLGTENGLRVIASTDATTVLTYGAGANTGYVSLSDNARPLETRAIDTTPPTGDIRCIAFDDEGVWVGADRGLYRATRRVPWHALPPIDRPAAPNAGDVRQGPAGTNQGKPAVAVYGPRNRTIAIPGAWDLVPGSTGRIDLLATQLAIEGTGPAAERWRPPIELAVLTPGYAAYGWGLPEDDFVDFAAQAKVGGIVGYLSRHERHAERAIRFARIPFVTFAAGHDDFESPDHPWIFRCYGDAPARHRLLLDHLIDDFGIERPAVLYLMGRESQPRRAWWRDHAARRGHPLVAEVGLDGRASIAHALSQLTAARPDAILTWENEEISAEWLRQIRGAGLDAVFVGGPDTLNDEFGARAGGDAGRVIACQPSEERTNSSDVVNFVDAYAERNVIGARKVPPDSNAHGSHDATLHLLEAVRAAGQERRGVRHVLRLMRDSSLGEAHHERLHGPGALVIGQLSGGQWTVRTIRDPR